MRGLRLAVNSDTGDRLYLRLGDMAVEPNVEISRDAGAAQNEIVRAVMRNGRRHGRAHQIAIDRPDAKRISDRP